VVSALETCPNPKQFIGALTIIHTANTSKSNIFCFMTLIQSTSLFEGDELYILANSFFVDFTFCFEVNPLQILLLVTGAIFSPVL
jgi:hypothetical protein